MAIWIFLSATAFGNTLAWFENDGNGRSYLELAENISTDINIMAVGVSAPADMDGDGDMDFRMLWMAVTNGFVGMRLVEQDLRLRIGQFHLVYQKV